MFSNKKGSVLDWFFIMVVLFVTFAVLIISYLIVDKVDATGVFADDTDAQLALDKSKSTLLNMDNLMLFVIIGLSVFVLVSSALVFSHPAYFISGVFLLFIAVIVSASVSNNFWILTNSDALSATTALFPKTTFIMDKLPFYIMFMGVAALVVSYIAYTRQ